MVSTDQTRGSIFHESVVLLLRYGRAEDGGTTTGVILNKKVIKKPSLCGKSLLNLPFIRSFI